MRKSKINHWSEEELERLKHLVLSGATALRAAAALKRSISTVKVKARLLRVPFPTNREAKKQREAKYAAAGGLQARSYKPPPKPTFRALQEPTADDRSG